MVTMALRVELLSLRCRCSRFTQQGRSLGLQGAKCLGVIDVIDGTYTLGQIPYIAEVPFYVNLHLELPNSRTT